MKAINLLPSDLRGTSSLSVTPKTPADGPGGIGAYVVLGALAACVIALATYVLTTNTVKDRQAKLKTVTAQAETTTQRANQLKPYADFQAMAETRIQTVKDLASSRFDWEQALRDISRAIPANVTLTSLDGTIAEGASAGGAAAGGSTGAGASTVRSAISAPAIELNGCTRSQGDVATLMSRLRNVDGVTRVSLGKSIKPEVTPTTGTAAAAPTTTTTAQACPGKRPPSFDLVMFFERSEVPATVQDITVQPQAEQPASTDTQSGNGRSTSGFTQDPVDPAGNDPTGGGTSQPPVPTPQGGGTK
jgi:Tfp pilus assembly protein PilN